MDVWLKNSRKTRKKRIISKENSQIVNKFMAEVVLRGTAKKLNLEDIGGACGKTGSAQAILNGENTIHGWFSGYYPRENPKYVITVFVEEGFSGF
jgi:penicillin-binding protein 2